MPYKRFGNCVHKLNPDGSKGKLIACHESPQKADRQVRALYANVEKAMATTKQREKRRERRLHAKQVEKAKDMEVENVLSDEDELLEESDELQAELEAAAEKELTQKDMYGATMSMMGMGPTSWNEMDELEAAREKNAEIREASYKVQDLVYNILYHPAFSVEEKSNAIKAVGDEFGTRVQTIMDKPVEKELDMDLLELEALIAKDNRAMSVGEKVVNWFTKTSTDSEIRLDTKNNVRAALSRVAKVLKEGGEPAEAMRGKLPEIKGAAKKFEIGMGKGLILEKDASGAWRAVMFPTNNFKDWDGEILSEKAHLEYVEWANKNMDLAPVFLTWHRAGTRREAQIDFVGYENGFLIMSAPLTEKEAAGLLRAQTVTDIGMSHGTFVLERDGGVINQYRMVEVSDLPLENAANPFTDFAILTKEANMDTKKYLAEVLGSDELAEKYLARTETKQKELRDAGVKEAEKPAETPAAPVQSAVALATVQTNKDEIVAQVLKELDVEGLQEYLTKANEAIEKVPVLEGLVRDLSKSRDDQLVEVLTPKAERKFLWSKARASESKETVVTEKDEKLIKSAPGIDDEWASALGVTPLQ